MQIFNNHQAYLLKLSLYWSCCTKFLPYFYLHISQIFLCAKYLFFHVGLDYALCFYFRAHLHMFLLDLLFASLNYVIFHSV